MKDPRRRYADLRWVVAVSGLGLAIFLAVAGTLQGEFDYTYVALTALGLVGFVVKGALDDPPAERDDEPEDSNVPG